MYGPGEKTLRKRSGLGSGTLVRDSSHKINSNLSLTPGQVFTALWLAYSSHCLNDTDAKRGKVPRGVGETAGTKLGWAVHVWHHHYPITQIFMKHKPDAWSLFRQVVLLICFCGDLEEQSILMTPSLYRSSAEAEDWSKTEPLGRSTECLVATCLFLDLENIVSEPTSLLIYRVIPSDMKGKWRLSFIPFRGRITASLSPS